MSSGGLHPEVDRQKQQLRNVVVSTLPQRHRQMIASKLREYQFHCCVVEASYGNVNLRWAEQVYPE